MGQLSYLGKLALKAHNSLVNIFILHHQLTYLSSGTPQPAPSRANAASTLTHVNHYAAATAWEKRARKPSCNLSSSSNKTAALCRKGLGHDETAGDSEHRFFSNRHNSFSVWFLSHDALSQSGLVAELKPNCCTNIYALGGLSQAKQAEWRPCVEIALNIQ
jgi:hypothetical protein